MFIDIILYTLPLTTCTDNTIQEHIVTYIYIYIVRKLKGGKANRGAQGRQLISKQKLARNLNPHAVSGFHDQDSNHMCSESWL